MDILKKLIDKLVAKNGGLDPGAVIATLALILAATVFLIELKR